MDGNGNPSLVLTSSTSIPSEDTSENEIRKWARESQIPSIAVLDQWHNYARRFTDTSGNLHLPDVLAVPDKLAKEEATEDGIPSEIIEITGQPYLENIASKKLGTNIRQKYDISNESKLIIFASECVRRIFGDVRGFDECSILKALVEVLLEINDSDIVLGIKLHPRNKMEDFDQIKSFLDKASKKMKIIFFLGIILLNCPAERLSMVIIIESSLFERCRTRALPIAPAPPVTRNVSVIF